MTLCKASWSNSRLAREHRKVIRQGGSLDAYVQMNMQQGFDEDENIFQNMKAQGAQLLKKVVRLSHRVELLDKKLSEVRAGIYAIAALMRLTKPASMIEAEQRADEEFEKEQQKAWEEFLDGHNVDDPSINWSDWYGEPDE